MTKHFYEHSLATICYYKYGAGSKALLCFHGFGMHGKQFYCLEDELGSEYTFYGLDLFFHKETELKNNNIENIKRGLEPEDFTNLILDFCQYHQITDFSTISYSMGTIYASVLLDSISDRISESFFIAPSFLKVSPLLRFLAMNKVGNYFFEKLALSEKGLFNFIQFLRTTRILDHEAANILWKEVATPTLRFNLFASFTYLKKMEVDLAVLGKKMESSQKPLYFIFGAKDNNVKAKLSNLVAQNFKTANYIILAQGHDLVNRQLTKRNLFCKI